ncbi:MAG: PEP-utilizing enzyme [Spirochaetia bacterium]|nr:PEP-utilizing enzyme [Spirochaetia bacterium]
MTIPGSWLEEYLEATGLGARLTILAGRFPLPHASLEAALEISLEAYWLFGRFPLPEILEARILASIDSLKGSLLVRASGPSCGASGVALWQTNTRASLLYTIRAAWARAYAPAFASLSSFASQPVLQPAWPTIAVVERSAASTEELAGLELWSERLPDGQYLSMSPQDLAQSLEAAAAEAGGGERASKLAEIGAYSRYALGCSYNSVIAPSDPFEFLGLLSSGGTDTASLRERYLTLSHGSGRLEAQAYIDLATRSLALETDAVNTDKTVKVSTPLQASARHVRIQAQQLIGLPSSPGRAAGILRRTPGAVDEPLILACERFNPSLMALKPAAVIESQGGRLGSGALLARAAGIPCVSGVRDAAMFPDGIHVRLDGWLGLVSVGGDAGD